MPRGSAAARLERHGRQARVDHADFQGFVGLLEGGFRITRMEVPGEGDVRPEFWMGQRRALLECLFGIDYSRKRLVVDFDEVERIPRDCAGLSNYDSNRVTDEVGARAGQDRVTDRLPAREWRGAGDRSHFVIQIRAGKNADDARQFLRGAGIDGED